MCFKRILNYIRLLIIHKDSAQKHLTTFNYLSDCLKLELFQKFHNFIMEHLFKFDLDCVGVRWFEGSLLDLGQL